MARGVTNDLITLGVLAVGGYLIYTKTDWFQQGADMIKDLIGDLKPQGGGPLLDLGGSIGAGAGGAISTDTSCSGTALQPDHQGSSKRWESGNIPGNPMAYEVTWCGEFSGDDLTFKMYGPSHSGSACCWCVMHVKEDGRMVAGGEGPHPSSNCEHASSSKGGGGKAPCYKATIEPGPIQRGYALVGGKWVLRAEYKGPCGCSKKSSTKTGNTLMVRNDGNITTRCASVKPLGGATARLTYAQSLFTNNKPLPLNFYHNRMIVY